MGSEMCIRDRFCVKDFCRNGHTGSYTLVTPKGKLHFAELRSLILVTV